MKVNFKFSPSSIVPEQMAATNPNMFICDQYGKLPDIHGDGALAVNEAIRLSKLINKFVPAFSGVDNRIIDGFGIEKVEFEDNKLKVTISSGMGVVGRNLFRVPLKTDLVWEEFGNDIPVDRLSKGKICLFFEYNDYKVIEKLCTTA